MSNKIVVTKELKEQLTGLLPMRNNAKYSFTPSCLDSVPEEFKPVFYIHQLTNGQILEVRGMLYEEVTTDKKKSKTKLLNELKRKNDEYMEIVKSIIIGWDNLYIMNSDEEAELFEYSIDNIEELPEIVRTELFSEAIKISGFLPKDV